MTVIAHPYTIETESKFVLKNGVCTKVCTEKKELRKNVRNSLILRWAQKDLNLRPLDYESSALTS
jgi:hypothetical protein